MAVITSRHHVSASLRDFADQRIDILGFAKEEQAMYISESLKEFADKKTELKRCLNLLIINSIMHISTWQFFCICLKMVAHL